MRRKGKNVTRRWVWERGEVFFDRKRLCGGGLSRYVLIGFSASGGGLGLGCWPVDSLSLVRGSRADGILVFCFIRSLISTAIGLHLTLMRFIAAGTQCGATAFPASRLPPA